MLSRLLADYRPVGVDRPSLCRSRYLYPLFGLTFGVACLYIYANLGEAVTSEWSVQLTPFQDLPPLYSEYHEHELSLPQHNWSKTEPSEGERYLYVAGHTRALGWGNAIQEHLFNAFLAYEAGVSFVFDNYTWNDDGSLYSDYNGKPIPSQIPYSALIRGPLVGDPFPPDDDEEPAPRAVNRVYFDHICPKKRELDRQRVHAKMALDHSPSASLLVETWTEIMQRNGRQCVQTTKSSGPIFTHHQIFGIRKALEDIWPAFAASPIITQFGWSPLVEHAFDNNRALFLPNASTEAPLGATPYTSNAARYTPIPGLMVIHVRRGDYEEHCALLADLREDFVGVHTFPDMPDEFDVPPRTLWELWHASAEAKEHYRRRCFPSVAEIADKVAEVRASAAAQGVRRLFVMTNAQPDFLGELKDALRETAEWEAIWTSRDVVLDWEQKYVAQAVDQLVAQRAQVLIGNGFSTLTSHVVMMRKANGFPNESNRFW